MLFTFIREESGGKHTCVCQVEWEKRTENGLLSWKVPTGECVLDSKWEAGFESPLAFKTKNQAGLKTVRLFLKREENLYL